MASAEQALKKTNNPLVKNYASTMIKEHGKNLQDTLKISHEIGVNPLRTKAVINLTQEGKKEMALLIPLSDNKFDSIYINAMVKDHTEALNLINQKLLKNVNNPKLKDHLEETRNHVAHHLHETKSIQDKLQVQS